MAKGWHGENERHALARAGIKTGKHKIMRHKGGVLLFPKGIHKRKISLGYFWKRGKLTLATYTPPKK